MTVHAISNHLSDLAYHSSIGHVHFGLIGSSFMCFPAQKLEILAARGILELFDVGIVAILCQLFIPPLGAQDNSHLQAKLVKLCLYIFDDLRLEHLAFFEDLLH